MRTILASTLLLAACSGPTNSATASREADAVVTTDPSRHAARASVAVDPLQRGDLAGLVGARACRFTLGPGKAVLLVARVDLQKGAAATAVMRIDGDPRPLAAPNVGGFAGLRSDAQFAGTGITVSLVRTPGQPVPGAVAADLHVVLSIGPERTFHGVWRCDR